MKASAYVDTLRWPFVRGVLVFEFLFDTSHRIMVVRFGKALTAPALEAMRASVQRFVDREGPCHGILDLSAVETATVASAFIESFARRGASIEGRRVIVAPKDEFYGIARMFGAYADRRGDRVVVVRDMRRACAALAVETLDLHPVD